MSTLSTAPIPVPQKFINSNCASLYVCDLDAAVTDNQLFEFFSRIGAVCSVKVCRYPITQISRGFAFVNFSNPEDARRALEQLNYTTIKGKPIRIMFTNRHPGSLKSCRANVFIKNLHLDIQSKELHEKFASCGTVISCKVATYSNGQSKGFGFVQFEDEKESNNAISTFNGTILNNKKLYVGPFIPRARRSPQTKFSEGNSERPGPAKFTNVYIKNFSDSVTVDDLTRVLGQCGTITSAVVVADADGKSRCFGFANFADPEHAASAVKKINGHVDNDKVWYVGRAQRKSEREAELNAKYERKWNRNYALRLSNLYIKNLDSSIDDETLRRLFSKFGRITSCKVMVDAMGQSRGFGFVAFSSPEEAYRALYGTHTRMFGSKPLYVSIAQPKEERKKRLQAEFARFTAAVIPAYPLHSGYSGVPWSTQNFMMPYRTCMQGQPGQQFFHHYVPCGRNYMPNAYA